MRTTLDLPQDLIQQALQITHCKNKTALIIKALEDTVRKYRIQKLKAYNGKINLDIDLKTLRNR
jgi:Arc/MetJ family transcription regulator